MAEGGEVYVLDMGEPIRIYDMARAMINLSGLTVRDDGNPNGDIEIREIGLRKGEKLYEELLIGDLPEMTNHPRIMRAMETMIVWTELTAQLNRLNMTLIVGDRKQSIEVMCKLVPEFTQQVNPQNTLSA